MPEIVASAHGLDVGYEGCEVVTNLNFEFQPGEIVCLLGPNGSGKSTILKTFSGIVPRIRGEITLGGTPLDQLSPRDRAKRVAFVPQEESIPFRFLVSELVAMGRIPQSTGLFDTAEDRQISTEALETADCAHLATRVASDLSGGEKQRVLIARALAQQTPLILLDEPTAHMDPEHQVSLVQLVRKLAEQGKSIVLALHDLNVASALGGRSVVIGRRQILVEGPTSEVLASPALEEAYRVKFWRQDGHILPLYGA